MGGRDGEKMKHNKGGDCSSQSPTCNDPEPETFISSRLLCCKRNIQKGRLAGKKKIFSKIYRRENYKENNRKDSYIKGH